MPLTNMINPMSKIAELDYNSDIYGDIVDGGRLEKINMEELKWTKDKEQSS